MSSWPCPECRTVYADGIPACPNHEEVSMAKVGAAGATQYVAEDAPVPVDLPAAVRLVGPGSPAARARARARAKDPAPDPAPAAAPAAERAPVTLSRARTGAAG